MHELSGPRGGVPHRGARGRRHRALPPPSAAALLRPARVRRAIPRRGGLEGREAPDSPDGAIPHGRPLGRPGVPQLDPRRLLRRAAQRALPARVPQLVARPLVPLHAPPRRAPGDAADEDCPPPGPACAAAGGARGRALEQIGRELGARNAGIPPPSRRRSTALVADALGLARTGARPHRGVGRVGTGKTSQTRSR